MATYTFKIETVCSGGEHVSIGLYKDGAKTSVKNFTKTDLTDPDVSIAEVASFLMRQSIKDHDANTAAKRKTAIEAIQVIL